MRGLRAREVQCVVCFRWLVSQQVMVPAAFASQVSQSGWNPRGTRKRSVWRSRQILVRLSHLQMPPLPFPARIGVPPSTPLVPLPVRDNSRARPAPLPSAPDADSISQRARSPRLAGQIPFGARVTRMFPTLFGFESFFLFCFYLFTFCITPRPGSAESIIAHAG